MLTEQLFEHWNLDPETIVRTAGEQVGAADFLLGGSLADDLGTETSDVDVYCFVAGDPPWTGPRVARCGAVSLELHVVDVQAAARRVGSLLPLVVTDPPPVPERWPFLAGGDLRLLHALYCDRRLHATTGNSEWLRQQTGADLLHVHSALRASLTGVALAEDAEALTGRDHLWTALYCARLAAESGLDAALACAGLVNPNPKWRLPLAARARLVDETFPCEKELVKGLFPTPDGLRESTRRCLETAAECLRRVMRDAFLMRFPIVSESLHNLVARVSREESP